MAPKPVAPHPDVATDLTDQAYGAASSFIRHLGTLAYHARHYTHRPDQSDAWKKMGGTFALAFIAQHDLSNLLTSEVRAAARRAYRPGAASIKLGRLPAKPSVIEAIADELGVFFRNLFYQSKPTPIDSKGVRSSNAALTLMADEWINQDPRLVGSQLRFLRCDAIDFDDLKVQLDRETRGILPPSADVACSSDCRHSEDFTSVIWHGQPFEFSKGQQAEAVRVLWNEGGLALSQETIGEKIDSEARRFRLVDVFRRHNKAGKQQTHQAWGAMIEPVGKGKFRLADRKI